jgi:hypothetical protein
MTTEDAILWTMIGGVGLLVFGLSSYDYSFPDEARVAMAFGASCITWAMFRKRKSG